MNIQHDSSCAILFPGTKNGEHKVKVGPLVFTLETARDLVKCLGSAIEKIERINTPEQEYLIFVMDDLTNDQTAYPIMARSPMLAAEKFALSCGDTHTVYSLLVEDQEGQQQTFTVTLSTRLEANVLIQREDLDENH